LVFLYFGFGVGAFSCGSCCFVVLGGFFRFPELGNFLLCGVVDLVVVWFWLFGWEEGLVFDLLLVAWLMVLLFCWLVSSAEAGSLVGTFLAPFFVSPDCDDDDDDGGFWDDDVDDVETRFCCFCL